MHYICIKKE